MPRTGYVYGIQDPEDPNKYIYIGCSQRPWEAILRMIYQRKYNAKQYNLLRWLLDTAPMGIEILGQIIVDRYMADLEGDPIPPLPPPHPYRRRINWDILGVQDYSDEETQSSIHTSDMTLTYITRMKLREQGRYVEKSVPELHDTQHGLHDTQLKKPRRPGSGRYPRKPKQ